MPNQSLYRWSLALVIAATALAGPADAQGKKDKKDKRSDRARPELVRRDDSKAREKAFKEDRKRREEQLRDDQNRYDDWLRDDRRRDDDRLRDRYDRRRDDTRRDHDGWEFDDDRWEGDRARGGPPFCRSGQGHPVHGRRWCEDKGWGLGRDDRYDDRRDEPWYDDRNRDRYGSYDREHHEFHRWHDRECRARAAERPLDIRWQIQVRQQCKARHDDWHYRAGRSHS